MGQRLAEVSTPKLTEAEKAEFVQMAVLARIQEAEQRRRKHEV